MAKTLTQLALDNVKPGQDRREIPDGHTRGLFLIVQPTGRKAWAVRYRIGGRTRKLTIGPYPAIGLKEARTRAASALATLGNGTDPAADKQAGKSAKAGTGELVENVIDSFVKRYAKVKQRPQTAYETERVLNREIMAHWRGQRLSEIKKPHIVELLDEIIDRGSPIQANRTLAAFRRMCSWAAERGLIDASPCAGVKAPAAEKSRDRILSDDELKAVWRACEALGWPFGPLVQLLALTGQRRSEVAEICWREVDFDARTWTLPRDRSKNGIEHLVPLSDPAVEILKTLPHVAGKAGFVFTTNSETPVSGFAKAKERLDTALPPDMQAWTLHDLRRTFASGAARLGIAVHVVEAVLNHKSGTILGVAAVYNRYSYDTEKRACLDGWGRYVEGLINGRPATKVIELAMRGMA